ncbi:hypothetical protein CCACVL1_10736 [Corchorus capsularis]|uniref:UDP-glucuronosyl/UDP-glucosyltransferase n=1 Tax=Corchorus capsularis TaxID=210143 RepID=A0A1R3IPW3_COCAP|nr:hypothetical protein CCACVL1_10736 [Corchorus capsularis]
MTMKKLELVFIPTPAIGHFVSSVEFAKRLLLRDDRFSASFLVKAAAPHSVSVFLRPEVLGVKFIESHKFCVKDSIINQVLLPEPVSVVGLVVDTFTISMIDVATELGFPSYLFNTSGYLNPIPSNVLPSLLFDKDGGGYLCFLNLVRRFKETKAIINNSFEELESHAVKTLSELEDYINNKPIFTVGPLLDVLHGRQTQSSLRSAIRSNMRKL